MSDTRKEPQIIVEENKENLLENFEKSQNKQKKPWKNSHIKALIIAVAVAVLLVGALLFLLFMPQDSGTTESTDSSGEPVKTVVDSDKVWQAETEANKKTSKQAGELLTLVPSDIKKMKVENEGGSFEITSYTPKKKTKETDPNTGETVTKTEATVYTLVGFENIDMQSGIPDEIASACSSLSFDEIVSEDASSSLADWGMDKPRSVVHVTYNDGTKAVITVGADAPQNGGTYVMFGSGKAVYLCDSEKVEPLLYSFTKLISLTINDSASTNENSEFSSLTLGGSRLSREIKLEPNRDSEKIDNTHTVIAPVKEYAENNAASSVSGSIRGLYADAVVMVNPTAAQLNKLGLGKPYAAVTAKYPDKTVSLIASKPDGEGKVNLMKKGGNIVYQMASANLGWTTVTLDKLTSGYVLQPKLSALSGMTVTAEKTYEFKIKTTVTTTTDDEGEETSSSDTRSYYGGEELDEANFETFFRNAALLSKVDVSAGAPSGKAALTIKYSYEKGGSDTVAFYKKGSQKYTAAVNGTAVGTVYASYVEKLIKQAPDAAADATVKTFW